MAHSSEAQKLEKMKDIPITAGRIVYAITFLKVKGVLSDLIIIKSAMKTMRASLDFENDIATFKSVTMVVMVTLQLDKNEAIKNQAKRSS